MTGWVRVCPLADLTPDRGVAALVEDAQVAVFLLADGALHAVGHRDPYSGAHVMARGLVGSRGEEDTVASPLHKQVFSLRTGRALDDPDVALAVWDVRVDDGVVHVAAPPRDVPATVASGTVVG